MYISDLVLEVALLCHRGLPSIDPSPDLLCSGFIASSLQRRYEQRLKYVYLRHEGLGGRRGKGAKVESFESDGQKMTSFFLRRGREGASDALGPSARKPRVSERELWKPATSLVILIFKMSVHRRESR